MNNYFKTILLLSVIFSNELLSQININSQHQTQNTSSGNIGAPVGINLELITKDGKVIKEKSELSEKLHLIVEFKEEPLFVSMKRNKLNKINSSAYKNLFLQFHEDINSLFEKSLKKTNMPFDKPEKGKEYYKVFYGVEVAVPKVILPEILKLNYVKRVHSVKKVKTVINESVIITKADQLRTLYNTEGEGIKIGIIDSGIDYMHEALGGGMGEGFKVIGGYDFINDDSDPMDDNGHGTHVAGIAAADGETIKGVAPKAYLLGFKVLDANGNGSNLHVLSGIEASLDPNRDDNFEDRCDVINLSLGGTGNPDDELSTAIDNVVELGVIAVVAAGNEGAFHRIGSPGTARKAITVGSSKKDEQLSEFSSKGPNGSIYSIKPEICAPGSNILSSFPGNKYEYLSGTSMASPHVAGICALLKKIHPEWTPEMIKSALVSTAVDLNYEIMAQGSGRVDALNAANAKTFTFPSTLSYGLANSEGQTWIKKDTLKIKNISNELNNYTISVNGLSAGISLIPDKNNFSINGNDSMNVVFTVEVDNNIVQFLNTGSFSYSGYVNLINASNVTKIPWAFVKAPSLRISSEELISYLVISNEANVYSFSDFNWKDNYRNGDVLIKSGVYDAVVLLNNYDKVVIKENINVENSLSIKIDELTQFNNIIYNPLDVNGNGLSQDSVLNSTIIKFPAESYFRTIAYSTQLHGFEVTQFSDRFSLHLGQGFADVYENKEAYLINYPPVKNITSNIILTNNPADYKEVNVEINIPDDFIEPNLVFQIVNRTEFDDFFLFSGSGNSKKISSGTWNGKIYVSPMVDNNVNIVSQISVFNNIDPVYNAYYFSSPLFIVDGDLIQFYNTRNPEVDTYSIITGGVLKYGSGVVYPKIRFQNNLLGSPSISFGRSIFGQTNDTRWYETLNSTYKIFDQNNVEVQSGLLPDFNPFFASSGQYKMIINDPYNFVENSKSNVELINEFDLSQTDCNPPYFTSIQVLNSDNDPTGKLKINEVGLLVFNLRDDLNGGNAQANVSAVKVYAKNNYLDEWIEVNQTDYNFDALTGNKFTYNINQFTQIDSAGISFKIFTEDLSGNTTQLNIDPAVIIGNYKGTTGIEEPGNNELPVSYNLYQNYPNPFNPATVISFDIPEHAKVCVQIFDILGRKVADLLNEELAAGNHKLTWTGKNNFGNTLASGVYFYRISTAKFNSSKKMIFMK